MSKTISWPARVTYIFIALALALSLAGIAAVSADPAKESEWDDVSTPSLDDFVIAQESNIVDFDMGPDGETIYAVGKGKDEDGEGSVEARLWKSEDSGATWDDITDEITDNTDFDPETDVLLYVAVAPDNADFVVVATADEVYGSNEGGDDFEDTGFFELAGACEILCLDVSCEVDDDEWNIAVGTNEGEIWRFVAGGYWGGQWKSTVTYPGWFNGVILGSVSGGTAEWSTDKASELGAMGDYSVKLTKDGTGSAGSTYVQFTPAPGTTITDLDTDIGSFWSYGDNAYTPDELVAQFELRFTSPTNTDPDGAGHVDVTVMPGLDSSAGWVEQVLALGTHVAFFGNPTTGGDSFAKWDSTLATVVSDINTANTVDSAADILTWKLTRVRVELYNAGERTVYIDNITIAGTTTYYLEPSAKAVTSVAFSPIFDGDETILAVTTVAVTISETTTYATYLQSGRWDTTKEWNDEAGYPFPPAVKIALGEAESSGIALPSDYDGLDSYLRKVFAYVNVDNKGYLQRIDSSKVYPCPGRGDFGFCPDADGDDLFASLAYYGTGIDGKFMLGEQGGNQVWRAEDLDFCCPEWSTASKKPTGTDALVAFAPDGKKGYAATSGGDESAFSVSLDGNGQYWNQLSLIDTDIDYLSDVALSPDCNTTLLFSVNEGGCSSVWFKAADLPEATEYNDVWLREWCDELTGTEGLIRLAPEEEERVFTVYLVDRGTDKVWHNDSSGLTKWIDRHCTRMDEITDLAVESESIIYALSEGGDVSSSTDNGRRWASAVDSKVDGHTIAVLGDYVLVGGEAGEASYSDDEGDSFTALDDAGEAAVHVAFDSYFEDNGVVYAASDSIYRCSDLEEGEWTDFKSNYGPDGKTGTVEDEEDNIDVFYGIVLDNAAGNPMTDEDTGGVLYAVYAYKAGEPSVWYTGMARVLGAADSKTEDYLDNGLNGEKFKAEPSALKICDSGNSLLWAINLAKHGTPIGTAYDLKEGKDNLFVYEDCLAKAGVELSEVEDGAVVAADPCYCWNDKFVLEWDDLCNSSTYELEIALDEDFDLVVKPNTKLDLGLDAVGDEYVLIPDETLDCNETYYWRVRVIKADSDAEIIRSWWSDGWSFTVQAGPMAAIQLTAPDSGATDVAIEGVAFTWTSVAAATSYDLALMDSAGSVVSSETGLTGTAYAYPGKLSFDTPYTWKVTAMKDGSVLSESSLSTFRTVTAAVFACPQCGLSFPTEAALKTHIDEAHPAAVPTTPSWVWVVIGLGAVLVITIIVLIFRTRRI